MNPRNTEVQAIAKVANLYGEGLHTGDLDMVRSAFHPKAMMYGTTHAGVLITEIEGLYAYVAANEAPAKTGEPHKYIITEVRYEGDAAVVEMIQESYHGVDYVNYFQLLKIEGKWQIVSKSYNGVPTKKQTVPEDALEMQATV